MLDPNPDADAALPITAYNTDPNVFMPLVPAPLGRDWMDGSRERFANRCLPLLMANQSGWFVLNNRAFSAHWDGGRGPEAVRLTCDEPEGEFLMAVSHFGEGIVTFHIPYLFRTPPGYNLLVRGPANWPKDGIYPLEGLIETDWTHASFTMNWQCTRPGVTAHFARREPVCMIVPQRRGELESFMPREQPLEYDPPVWEAHERWNEARAAFIADLAQPDSEAARTGWQKHYFQGRSPEGDPFAGHQTRRQLRPFEEVDA